MSHILVLDIGKTNKKALILNEDYDVLYEHSHAITEIADEDGFPCENINELSRWCIEIVDSLLKNEDYDIRTLQFSGYGASFVLIGNDGTPIAPLYNYLKPLDAGIQKKFLQAYGPQSKLSLKTASPWMGCLNSGLQLYRIKYSKPDLWDRVKYALHLPLYLSYLFSRKACSDKTSIGCHTLLWDFTKNQYHDWIIQEGLEPVLPPLVNSDLVTKAKYGNKELNIGIGLHDSSAALIPYLKLKRNKFILLSTGTWSIALNPFDSRPLTEYDLGHDGLCYMSFEGKPVKASRLFLGHEFETQIERIVRFFDVSRKELVGMNIDLSAKPDLDDDVSYINGQGLICSGFEQRALSQFLNGADAMIVLVQDLIRIQVRSIQQVIPDSSRYDLYVEGGFSQNSLFLQLLSRKLPQYSIYASQVHQASAIGAAMAIHDVWNPLPPASKIIKTIQF